MIMNVQNLTGSTKLWFGDHGVELRNTILDNLKKEKEKLILKVDLKGIEVTDTSYAREAFVNLVGIVGIEQERPQILFTNVQDHVKENMHLSFKEHKKFALITTEDGSWSLIGKYSGELVETIGILIKMKNARATKIKETLKEKIEMSALNNRLASLYEMCVVQRSVGSQETGGKEYLYSLNL